MLRQKIFLTFIIFLASINFTNAQLLGTGNQYYLTPYLVNPAALAINGVAELDVNYRKEWLAIQGAPERFKFLAQLPFANNFALGVTALGAREDLYESYGGMLSFSYKQPLSSSAGAKHYIAIGLSGGYATANLDYSQIDNPLDPALANLNNQSQNVLGQLGINYQWNGFMLGASLLDLFGSSPFASDDNTEIEVSPLQQTFSYIKYDFAVGEQLSISPWVSYNSVKNQVDNGILEGMLLLNYRNFVWAGASYKLDVGPVFRIGFNLKNLLKIGYGYENLNANGDKSGRSLVTHELHLNYRFLKKDAEQLAQKDTTEELNSVPQVIVVKVPVDNTVEPFKPDTTTYVVSTPEPAEIEPMPKEVTPDEVIEPKVAKQFKKEVADVIDEEKGHYVITGAFSTNDNAQRYAKVIEKEGFKPAIGLYRGTGYYYVILAKVQQLSMAKMILMEIRKVDLLEFDKSWILSIK